ncbi:MAG: NAD(P)/FAD-dependent oxidoreductase [Saprospiraceae bacterium]
MIQTDVLVIGAGPAGSVAAAKINKAGYSVQVVEREKFPRFVIGESLLPRCMEVLEDIDMIEELSKCGFQEKFGAKFLREDEISDFNFTSQFTKGWSWTWQVPRADFDMALIQQVIDRGVPVHFEHTVTGIQFMDGEESISDVVDKEGNTFQIKARFIVDASGYGRVIPRLFNMDKPSVLEPRKAVFSHLQDIRRASFDEPNRIIVVSYVPGVWVWIIPFSNGNTSVGFVGNREFFDQYGAYQTEQFDNLIANNPMLHARFDQVEKIFEPRKLEAWSSKTDQFFGDGFVLTGNVTEFLDPIFSSGVMFATVSSHLASQLVIQKLEGKEVNWADDYSKELQRGVDVFKSYVMAWYDGTLEKIFYAKNQDPLIKRQICSVLAGYVWDLNNPFVAEHEVILKKLARLIDAKLKLNL